MQFHFRLVAWHFLAKLFATYEGLSNQQQNWMVLELQELTTPSGSHLKLLLISTHRSSANGGFLLRIDNRHKRTRSNSFFRRIM